MSTPALPPLSKLDPAQAWLPWQPTEKDPWNLKWAGHLYRRAGFGAPNARLREAVEQGFPATLKRILGGEPNAEPREESLTRMGVDLAQTNNPFDIRGWWLERMLTGPHPLREKLCLFWHNHFATSIVKVQRPALMHRQNELIRQHALGKFRPFLLEMSKDPAMLVWLDSNSNVKGKPNENYAREIMELFSLGVGHYTEKDIREAARAFTGWHTNGNQFTFQPHLHDDGPKTVLGQAGDWNGDDVVRIVLEQDAAARFLVRKLYRFFVNELEEPPDALLQPLAAAFRKSDFDVALVVRTMLGSRHFFSAHAYRQRIKWPVEFLLDAIQAIGMGMITARSLVNRMQAMGQELFAPPNVKGWPGGKAWLNTATLLARHNFAQALALGLTELGRDDPLLDIFIAVDPATPIRRQRITRPEKVVEFFADALVQGDIRAGVRKRLIDFLQEDNPQGDAWSQRIREMIHAIMTTSEYQLA
jgi:uncharacterized protein (DUF1800 family)